MMQSQAFRFFHSTVTKGSVSNLAKLRKKTGYTFANCKKALETNDNDLVKAEKWLQDQAQALGWSKLAKLEGRAAAQGLIGLAYEGKKAALVEVNCETDFVARNKYFVDMVNLASNSCLQYIKKFEPENAIAKEWFNGEQVKQIESPDGKNLSDHAALLVSNVGENVLLRNSLGISVKGDINLVCYVHPGQSGASNILNGKYAAVIMYSAKNNNASTMEIVRQLCQHIIGMNPKRLKKDPDEIAAKEKEVKIETTDGEVKEENEEDDMLSQDFLLDPTMTVQELLAGSGIIVHDFIRIEVGHKNFAADIPEQKKKASQVGG